MQKIIATLLCCFILGQSFAQGQHKVSAYLLGQYNKTISDRTKGNNPWGVGAGLQALLNTSSKIKPALDLTADAYLEDDKVLRLNPDETPIEGISGMINVFIGASYHPTPGTYLSFVAGPSFINGQVLAGIKPSFGLYFAENKRWTGKISYINVFNRIKRTGDDFRGMSLSVGVKLF